MIVGRQDEAIALMADGIGRIDAAWPQAETLRNNYVSVLVNRLGELIDRKDFPTAVSTFGKYRALCAPHETCASNASIVFANWSIEHQRAGDWQSARKVLQDCVGELPSDSRCKDALSDLRAATASPGRAGLRSTRSTHVEGQRARASARTRSSRPGSPSTRPRPRC